MQHWIQRCVFSVAVLTGTLGIGLVNTPRAIAQIRPDGSLGVEGSVVVPHVLTRRGRIDRIDGGAIRGSNLFHSFSEFNVGRGQSVYFANPNHINTIISRVTGNSRSEIYGRLGVLGNADLFLLNPNGIIFGANAQLDIQGSFVATTGDRLLFPNGYAFRATDPNTPPLLAIASPLGLGSWLPNQGTIRNTGSLTVEQDLTFAARHLDLQGQLQAGGNLNLFASDLLRIRDSATTAFTATAGNRLLLQGNQSIAIDTLNHPNSELRAGDSLVLRSAQTISADAYFTSGGNVQIQQLDGSLGNLYSPYDPVIRASGNVRFNNYTGASLHIFAGGSVTANSITITGTDTTAGLSETVTLSNGRSLTINGRTEPTLDIRAGTTAFAPTGMTGDTSGFATVPATGETGSNANIAIGTILTPGGLVFLSNQYQPNTALSGDITIGDIFATDPAGGGSVVMDSRGGITVNSIDVSGYDSSFIPSANSGDVMLLADQDILIPFIDTNPFSITAWGFNGGSITLDSNTAIRQGDAPLGTDPFALSTIQSVTTDGTGGNIRLTAPVIALGGNVESTLLGSGRTGDLFIRANRLTANQGTIATDLYVGEGTAGRVVVNADSIDLRSAFLGSFSLDAGTFGSGPVRGDLGNVTVTANTLNLTQGGQIGSDVGAGNIGNAGNVRVIARQAIALSGFQPPAITDTFQPSLIFSRINDGVRGSSGTVTVSTGSLRLENGGSIFTSSFGWGNAGRVTVNASESIVLDGVAIRDLDGNGTIDVIEETRPSGIGSELAAGATGQGGTVSVTTPILQVLNGGTISTSTDGNGSAGDVTIRATQSVLFDGVGFDGPRLSDRRSSARVQAAPSATGEGGTLTIITPNLLITNGAQLIASTESSGDAGNIILHVDNRLLVEGYNSAILAGTLIRQATGDGGSVFIRTPESFEIRNGAQVAVSSEGTGTAGDLFVWANALVLSNQGALTAETVSNTGGNITLQLASILAMKQNSRISTTAGTANAGGDGGNIVIRSPFVVAAPDENSDITANAFTGQGGRVEITTEGLFGLIPRSREELETLLGTSDPTQLDPANLPTNDITAISQTNPTLNGEVVIRTPGLDPSQGTIVLPSGLVDVSRLLARGCAAQGAIARNQGSLVITGRGGLPPSPTEGLPGEALLVDWDTLDTESAQSPAPDAIATTASPIEASTTPRQIVEVQTLVRQADGQVILAAQPNHSPPSSDLHSQPETCPAFGTDQ